MGLHICNNCMMKLNCKKAFNLLDATNCEHISSECRKEQLDRFAKEIKEFYGDYYGNK